MTPRDWQKDMALVERYGNSNMPYYETEFSKALPYWLQEAKERGEREQRLKEAIDLALSECKGEPDYFLAKKVRSAFSTLYPDTPAPKEGE
ncbi:hypothetical protein [Paenibacillus pseudetheri]|uniref:Uncharacterized protein n=1 Tax=Paenibacillus pseudetheri TaxID=2897682 RepID=A0ABM9B6B2_9BACL|nr:hypothetical protein [Paenibacillus pseudetheri]CAH1054083.1 hypothetical protein PAECIP111894_00228 [Paenibacillus pseudetheri]